MKKGGENPFTGETANSYSREKLNAAGKKWLAEKLKKKEMERKKKKDEDICPPYCGPSSLVLTSIVLIGLVAYGTGHSSWDIVAQIIAIFISIVSVWR
jgi:hypothetical protein